MDQRFVRAAAVMAALLVLTGCTGAPVPAPTVTVTATVTMPPEPAPTVTVEAEPPRDAPLTKEQAWSLCASAGLGILYAARDRDGDGKLDQRPPVDAEWFGLAPADDYIWATPRSDYESVHEQDGVYRALVPIETTRQGGYDILATCDVSGSMEDPRVTVHTGTLWGD